jgi:membrane protein DedA with SNARE-associated domain
MQSFLVSHAIYAIILFGVLEAMCIPISSELTFLLGGAVASGGIPGTHQHPSLLLVIVIGTLAELVGSYVSYYVGRVGGKPLVRRWGRYVLVTEGDVARAERFLAGRGAWALPVARMLPFVRAFASIVAGFVDIPPVRFGVLSLIGTLIYVVVLSSIGYSLGGEWTKLNHSLSVASYIVVAVVVVAIIGFVIYRLREFRREGAAGASSSSENPADRLRR